MPDLDPRRWDRRFWLLFLAVTALRLGYAAWAPVDLSMDEAYYWDWSRRLDVCYYSKPPMVAWVIALFTGPLGSTTFTARLGAVVLGALTLLGTRLLARRMFGPRAGFHAAVLAAAIPGNLPLNLIMTIDAPLTCAWIWTALFLWEATERGGARAWWLTTLALVAGTLSKATMLVVPGLWPALLWGRPTRERGLALLPLAGVIAVLLMILWWNSQHDWIMFQHSAGHFGGQQAWLQPKRFGDFLGSQVGLVSPILIVLLAAAWPATRRAPAAQRRANRFLVLLCYPGLLVLLGLSLHQRVHANWSAPFYLTGTVLLAGWVARAEEAGRESLPRWYRRGVGLGATFAALIYLAPLVAPVLPLGGTKPDATRRVRGWAELGREVGRDHARLAAGSDGEVLVVAFGRELVSQLAFYLPGQPRTYLWSPGPVRNQYGLWPGPPLDPAGEALLVSERRELSPDALADFASVEPLRRVDVPMGTEAVRTVYLFRARGPVDWPLPE
jgi:4-amino-4-deoxy-L-arabinose transferase-like glycosyltransferase